ncbi:microtubule-associated serine/threonine-protein kinase 4-like isoform X2 [Phyllobates terribilis]
MENALKIEKGVNQALLDLHKIAMDHVDPHAEEKAQSGKLAFFKQLAQNVLNILESPARSLEHLEPSEGDSEEGQTVNMPDPNISQLELKTDLIEEITVSTASTDGGICETPEIHESASALTGSLNLETSPSKTDFKPIKLISSGAYGAVHLVRHIYTSQLFAMKKLDKENVNIPRRLERAFLERDILTFADCPFVASMLCSFPTPHHLCMVMEYAAGGDCGSFMKIYGSLPVPLARLYIAETVLAVEYLHSYGVMHRDLKPENLLITSTGHIQVTDFGLSKLCLMRPTSEIYKAPIEDITREFHDKEIAGSPHYIAPEVILKEGYGRPADWWSIGIILYKFLLGRVPFYGPSKYEIYSHIVRDDIYWKLTNSAFPAIARDIIIELLRKDPAQRLGTGGANEIKFHPFLRNLDFDNLLSQKSLFIPDLESEEDTIYFDTRCSRHQHIDSDEGDTSEDNDWPESQNFLSSSHRLSKLCSIHTKMMNNEEPKSPPGYSPESAKQSDIQKDSSPSKSDDDKQRQKDSPLSKSDDNQTQKDSPPSKSDDNQTQKDSPPSKSDDNQTQKDSPPSKSDDDNQTQKDSPLSKSDDDNQTQKDSPPSKSDDNQTQKDSPPSKSDDNQTQKDSPPSKSDDNQTLKDSSPSKSDDDNQTQKDSPPSKSDDNQTLKDSPPSKSDDDNQTQKDSPPSKADDDKQCFSAEGRQSSILSESPVQGKRKSASKDRQKTEKVEERRSRRGSTFRRLISSCRRGLSRVARSIRQSCIFAPCHLSNTNISM